MSSSALRDIDLTDLDLWADHVPHEWFAVLRREAPVWRHPATATEPEPVRRFGANSFVVTIE